MSETKEKGYLYLIPTKLGESDYSAVFPDLNCKIILSLRTFIIEDIRSARRFLKSLKYPGNFDNVQFLILNEHTLIEETNEYLDHIFKGENIGLLSDAGMPCIADPGNIIVQRAHREDIKVIPLIGPSSIFLALAASGFNGQEFSFHGYLPVKDGERSKKLKELEKKVWQSKQTQIFIEAPYRNQKIFESILKTCNAETMLCIACDLTLKNEYIKTKTVSEWRKSDPPIQKRPTVFLLSC
jgi:16S rRNA (cytidine1402-2'-O)-methyltransferase